MQIRKLAEEDGNAFVTVALILPLMLTLMLGASDLFLYFRAASVVERAAAEAAKSAAAAYAGDPSDYSNFSLPAVNAKVTTVTRSGFIWGSNYLNSWNKAGIIYQKASGAPPVIISAYGANLPYNLETPPTAAGYPGLYNPGVQYLPLVHQSTCLDPIFSGGSWVTADCLKFDLLYHQLPTKIDFDGDNKDDLAFYYNGGASSDPDWWVLPSSSGTLFTQSLEHNFGDGNNYYPCPADYDGDGKTDFCYYTLNGGLLFAGFNLSSTNFLQKTFLLHGGLAIDRMLPVPGRWTNGSTKDQFAVIITGTGNFQDRLATWVYPELQKVGGSGDYQTYSIAATPTKYDSVAYKPLPGRSWRPAFGDHDGDGDVDIGWLTWESGNKLHRVAGTGTAGNHGSQSAADAWTADIAPWGLFTAPSGGNKGLYVVERGNHRVSYISPGSDTVVSGNRAEGQIEPYRVISGISLSAGSPAAIVRVDPQSVGQFDTGPVPVAAGTDGCPSCEAGGNFAGDNILAYSSNLNSPRDVFTKGAAGDDLYVADFGNYRVRAIVPTDGGIVDGLGTEEIRTVIGGDATIACPSIAGPSPAPSPGDPSVGWEKYDFDVRSVQGIHPRCVKVRPISLAGLFLPTLGMDVLFIGDERGAIFGYYPGADGLINSYSDPNDRLFILYSPTDSLPSPFVVGDNALYGTAHSNYNFFPQAMQARNDGGTIVLVAAIRVKGIPEYVDTNMSLTYAFQTGADGLFGTGDDILDNNLTFMTSPRTRNRPVLYNSSSTANYNLINISDLYIANTTNGSNVGYQGYLTDWYRNGSVADGQVYGLYNIYFRSASFLDKGFRWLNNPHFGNWGAIRPSNRFQPFDTSDTQYDFALSTTPVEPAGGVAVDEANGYLYFSETERGAIYAVFLDRDADGSHDFSDLDIDGDGRTNVVESTGGNSLFTDYSLPDSGYAERQWHAYPDAKLNAIATSAGGMSVGGTAVDRMEWLLDKFGFPVGAPGVTTIIPGPDEPPYRALSKTTIAVAAPRGALHGDPVFSGGPSLPTQWGPDSKAILTPVVISKPRPSKFDLKSINGYDHCTDFSFDEFGEHGMSSTGIPTTICGRDISADINGITNGVTLKSAMRRAILGQWNDQWHPYASANAGAYSNGGEGHLVFLDRDGDGAQDPAIFNSQHASTRPFVVHFGNMQGTETGNPNEPVHCPGDFSSSELQTLQAVVSFGYAPALDQTKEAQNLCHTAAFFNTSASTPVQTVLADTHVEWYVATEESTSSLSALTSNRFSLGTAGDLDITSQIGPVAETAYVVLETSLRVDQRESIDAAHHARVTFTDVGTSQKEIRIDYVMPLNSIIANIFGADSKVISKTIRTNIFNFGNNA